PTRKNRSARQTGAVAKEPSPARPSGGRRFRQSTRWTSALRNRTARYIHLHHLDGTGLQGHRVPVVPIGDTKKERAPVRSAERACEATAAGFDDVGHRAAFQDSYACLADGVCDPDRAGPVETDPVRRPVRQFGKYAAMR